MIVYNISDMKTKMEIYKNYDKCVNKGKIYVVITKVIGERLPFEAKQLY